MVQIYTYKYFINLYIKQVFPATMSIGFSIQLWYFIDLCNLVYEVNWKMKRIAQVFGFATLELV